MKALLSLLLGVAPMAAAAPEAPWSAEVAGLSARLAVSAELRTKDWPFLLTYVELRNGGGHAPISVPFDPGKVAFTVVDANGKAVAVPLGNPYNGPFPLWDKPLRLPTDSTLRFSITRHAAAPRAGVVSALDLGPQAYWHFAATDKGPFFLKGRFTVARDKAAESWAGTIDFPPVRLPPNP